MLVSGCQGDIQGFSYVVRFCCARCSLFQAVNHSVVVYAFLAIMTPRQTNNSLAAALSFTEVSSALVSSTALGHTSFLAFFASWQADFFIPLALLIVQLIIWGLSMFLSFCMPLLCFGLIELNFSLQFLCFLIVV